MPKPSLLSNQVADSFHYSINKKGIKRGLVHSRRRDNGPPAVIWVQKHSTYGKEHEEVGVDRIRYMYIGRYHEYSSL